MNSKENNGVIKNKKLMNLNTLLANTAYTTPIKKNINEEIKPWEIDSNTNIHRLKEFIFNKASIEKLTWITDKYAIIFLQSIWITIMQELIHNPIINSNKKSSTNRNRKLTSRTQPNLIINIDENFNNTPANIIEPKELDSTWASGNQE